MKKLLIVSILFLSTSMLWAQKQISGKVTSKTEVIPGVAVVVKGTSIGVITDIDGNYKINVPGSDNTLIFSFMGKKSKEVAVGNQSVINVDLEDDDYAIDEVVAIGYGVVKKSDLTGSVSRVTTKDLEQRSVGSTEQLLQGATPGVQVTTTGGAPGADVNVTIRGGNSLNASNAPLYIIDGVEMNSSSAFYSSTESSGSTPAPSPLSMINPNDIESFDVLKDASATAIYGSRGANGVIIITTKKGKIGTSTIQLSVSQSVSDLLKKIDVINSKDYALLRDEAAVNSGVATIYGDPSEPSSYDIYTKNVNWQDQMYRTAIGRDINLSIRGGKNGVNYSFSGNYNDTEGVIINSDQRRISLRSNVKVEATKFLEIGADTYFSNTMSNIVPYSNKGINGFFSPIMMAVQFRPYDSAWDEDFDVNLDDLINDGSAPYNPITQIRNTIDEQRLNFAQSNLYGNIKLAKWLSFKSSFGFNYSNALRNSFWGRGTQQGDFQNNIVARGDKENFDYLNENTLSYDFTLNEKHRISGVLGESAHKWIYRSLSNRASGFDVPSLGYESFKNAAVVGVPDALHLEWGLLSFFGRLNYTYDDKYLFTFNGRYDASSHFAKGNKWGFFPSAAFAWKIKNENFMSEAKKISDLKLRLSYGASGSQAIDPLSIIPLLETGSRYPVSNTFSPGVISLPFLYNNKLSWETTYQANIGVDFGMFDNRLTLTADYYQKSTKDLLLNKDLPVTSGFPSGTIINGGEVQNRGWELQIGGDIIRKQDMRLNASVSLSQNRSKVKYLDGDDYIYGSAISGIDGGYPSISYLNGTVGLFYGYQTNGIYQTAADAVDAPTKSGVAPGAGDIIYVDQATVATTADDGTVTWSGDGEINDDDRVVIGNPEPDLIFGFNLNFDYKNFGLGMIFNGTLGNDVLNLNRMVWEGMNIWDGRYSQTQAAFDGRWVDESTPATYAKPSMKTVNPDYLDRYVEDGSFLRMQSISLSYDWKPKGKSIISSVKPYFSASNLFVITNYSGYDPEIRGVSTALSPGIDLGAYPIPRTFKFGVNLTLK